MMVVANLSAMVEVAHVTALRGEAVAANPKHSHILKLGDGIFQKDVIKTSSNSKIQMIFQDDTIVTVGKESVFSVEEYVFDDAKEPEVHFGMVQGAMRTITGKVGKIAPQKFRVQTKTATIGIRGTNFTLNVSKDGSLTAYCSYGAIGVTYNSEVHVVEHGYMLHIDAGSKISVQPFTPKVLKQMKKGYFGLKQPAKKEDAQKGEISLAEEKNAPQELDVTVEDQSAALEALLSEESASNVQNVKENIKPTLADLIASYTMNNASYSGTFSGTNAFGNAESGSASLNIDFGANTADLLLQGVNGQDVQLNQTVGFSGTTFNVEGQGNPYGIPTADGTFQEPTGNDVIGNYSVPDSGGTATGTYSVSTSQTLH